MVRYMKCPRCELNYIDAEKQTFCDICLKEMKGIPVGDDFEDEDEDLATELCPVCGENMMHPGDKMCEACRKRADLEAEEPDPEQDDDEEWRNYLDAEDDEEDDDELAQINETFDEDEEEEEEDYQVEEEEEDFEYVTGDDIYALGDDEDDEDEDDDGDDF